MRISLNKTSLSNNLAEAATENTKLVEETKKQPGMITEDFIGSETSDNEPTAKKKRRGITPYGSVCDKDKEFGAKKQQTQQMLDDFDSQDSLIIQSDVATQSMAATQKLKSSKS